METEKVVTEDIMASSAQEVPAPEQGTPVPPAEPPVPPVEPPVQDEKSKKSFLRACASWTDIFVIAAMLSVLLILFGDLLSLILNRWVIPANQIGMNLLGDADSVEFLLQYFNFYGIWIVFMLVILLFKSNWPMWKAFLYNGHGNNLKAIPAGILLGFGMNGFCILMSVIMGDIKLSFNGFDPKLFFIFLFCVLIQSGADHRQVLSVPEASPSLSLAGHRGPRERIGLYVAAHGKSRRDETRPSSGLPDRRSVLFDRLLLGQPLDGDLGPHRMELLPEHRVRPAQQRYCVKIFCLQA